jgi:hypothetical protein
MPASSFYLATCAIRLAFLSHSRPRQRNVLEQLTGTRVVMRPQTVTRSHWT